MKAEEAKRLTQLKKVNVRIKPKATPRCWKLLDKSGLKKSNAQRATRGKRLRPENRRKAVLASSERFRASERFTCKVVVL